MRKSVPWIKERKWRGDSTPSESVGSTEIDTDAELQHADCSGAPSDPMEHLSHAAADYSHVGSPVSVLTPEQTSALHRLVMGPAGLFWQTESTLRWWQDYKLHRVSIVDAWRDSLPQYQRQVVGKLDPCILQALLQESRHDDGEFVNDLLQGFPVRRLVLAASATTSLVEC